MNGMTTWTYYIPKHDMSALALIAVKPKPNTRTQATARREVRRRSNLPKSMQKRLGFKYH